MSYKELNTLQSHTNNVKYKSHKDKVRTTNCTLLNGQLNSCAYPEAVRRRIRARLWIYLLFLPSSATYSGPHGKNRIRTGKVQQRLHLSKPVDQDRPAETSQRNQRISFSDPA